MDFILNVDWAKVFLPSISPLEIIVRGSVLYLSLFFLLRVILKRQAGTVGISDLLVVVLLADAAQNAMAGEYTSITDGLLLTTTIILWSYCLDWLSYRFPRLEGLIHAPPLPLIKEGQIIRRNLRQEFITPAELMSMLREEGVETVADVKLAHMEGDGKISVIPYGAEHTHTKERRGT